MTDDILRCSVYSARVSYFLDPKKYAFARMKFLNKKRFRAKLSVSFKYSDTLYNIIIIRHKLDLLRLNRVINSKH